MESHLKDGTIFARSPEPPRIGFTAGSEANNMWIEVHLTSKQFAHAAEIAEEIESLEKQINDLLLGKEVTFCPASDGIGKS